MDKINPLLSRAHNLKATSLTPLEFLVSSGVGTPHSKSEQSVGAIPLLKHEDTFIVSSTPFHTRLSGPAV